ncbi:6082_t:CDS:2 [Paraglomus occultum]|uniref:6082_t:CDS:1 n=1 Tax=Paraglomus occultum TaxID=144539 RepID=A0A9N9FIM1_9GLOM|nr:6082_t:CDS:2 [Paraglomus occultum]
MSIYAQLTTLIPQTILLLPLLLLTIILLHVIHFYISYITRENPLPGPIPLPLVGNLHQMSDTYRFFNKCYEQYGDIFEYYIGNRRAIMLNRVDMAENILTQSTKSKYFLRLVASNQGWEELGFTERGLVGNKVMKNWSLNRRMLNFCLTSTKYIKEMVNVAQERFSEAEGYWAELGDGTPLEFTKWMHGISVDTQIRTLTGQMTYALSAYRNSLLAEHQQQSLPDSAINSYSKFINHLCAISRIGQFFYLIPWYFRHYAPGIRGTAERMKKEAMWLQEEVRKIVQERKKEIENLKEGEELRADLLSLMLTINTQKDLNVVKTGEFERPLNEDEIIQLLIEAFSAGVDSITNALCFAIYHICKHPAAKSRLIAEIDAALPSDTDILSYESLSGSFPYTTAVMKESSRLLTVAPIIAQVSSEDDELAGYRWRAGITVGVNHGIIHRHKAYWKDPEAFKPERFLDECEDKVKPKTFLPFGGTLRICPGRFVADRLIKTFLIMLFRKYEVELCEPDKEVEYYYAMTNKCKGLKVYLKNRNKEHMTVA